MARFCTACGASLGDETARFCAKCGAAVGAPQSPVVALPAASVSGSVASSGNDKTLPASGLNTKAPVAVPPKFLRRLSIGVAGRKGRVLLVVGALMFVTVAGAVVASKKRLSVSEYEPAGVGSAFFSVVTSDLNHKGTGAQAVLLEVVYNTLDESAGHPAGHFFVVYNPKVEDRPDSKGGQGCDLSRMVFDPSGGSYEQLNVWANGEGPIGGYVYQQSSRYAGQFPADGCRFVLFGVRSDGTHIPDDAWSKGAQLAANSAPASGPHVADAQPPSVEAPAINPPQQSNSDDSSDGTSDSISGEDDSKE